MDERLVYIINILDKYGISVDDGVPEKYLALCEMLSSANKTVNLTAITDFREIVVKHILDSIMLVKYLPVAGKKLIDIGSGAGFPGIPLAILETSMNLTSLEAVNKKVMFQKSVCESLNMNNAEIIHGRAEDAARLPEYRESFDIAAFRAVSSLPVLIEYGMPFLKNGGILAAYKSADTEDDITSSANALALLNGKILSVETFEIENIKRSLILIEKTDSVSDKYPRKAGKPVKKPL